MHTDPSKRKRGQILHFSTNLSTAHHYVGDEIVEYVVIPFFSSVLKKTYSDWSTGFDSSLTRENAEVKYNW